MKRILVGLIVVFILFSSALIFGQRARKNRAPKHLIERNIRVGKLERKFYVFVPRGLSDGKKASLLFVFHGGGGNPLSMDRRLGFTELARKEKFIVVYPAGIGGNWNDGRETNSTKAHREKIDDLGFVKAMINSVSNDFAIDKRRIFATGASNGGIFSHYVGANLSNKFAAIAPVIGGIADPFYKRFAPKEPVSVFIVQGTEDRLVPYDGNGGIGFGRRRNRGKIISTDAAIALWTKHNSTNVNPEKGNLPDVNRRDGCTVETFNWVNGRAGSEVRLYKLNGGGHTWAGGQQYLPRMVVGNVCRDFSATEAIWKFFKRHPKP